jgi:hypothetical protein
MVRHVYKLIDGTRVPGVTTILSRFKEADALIYWAWKQGRDGKDFRETKDKAAEAGTLAHTAVEAHIRGDLSFHWPEVESEVTKKAKTAFGAFLEWSKQTNLEVTHTEVSLVSERHKFGGTLDAMLVNGKRALADWKTSGSVYPDYLCQLGAYGLLWEENYPHMPITGGYHLIRFDKAFGDFTHRYWGELETAKKAFLLMRELYSLDDELKARAR